MFCIGSLALYPQFRIVSLWSVNLNVNISLDWATLGTNSLNTAAPCILHLPVMRGLVIWLTWLIPFQGRKLHAISLYPGTTSWFHSRCSLAGPPPCPLFSSSCGLVIWAPTNFFADRSRSVSHTFLQNSVESQFLTLCSSKKYPYSPHERDWKFLGGGGFPKT